MTLTKSGGATRIDENVDALVARRRPEDQRAFASGCDKSLATAILLLARDVVAHQIRHPALVGYLSKSYSEKLCPPRDWLVFDNSTDLPPAFT
jgi:hypothetical protein